MTADNFGSDHPILPLHDGQATAPCGPGGGRYKRRAAWIADGAARREDRQAVPQASDQPIESGAAFGVPLISDFPEQAVWQPASQLEQRTFEDALASAKVALSPWLREIAATEERNRICGGRAQSPTTLEGYYDIFKQLLHKYCHEQDMPCDLDLVFLPDFGEWLLSRRSDLKPASWRTYRSAVLATLKRLNVDDLDYIASLLLDDEGPSGETGGRNAKGRARYFDPLDFDRALHVAGGRGQSARSARLVDYLRANIRLGLRPCEFLSSELRLIPDKNAPYDRQAWLFVCSAKFGAGYSNGPIRSLDLSQLDNRALETVRCVIEDARLQAQIIGYDRWLNSLNMALRQMQQMHKGHCDRRGQRVRYTAYSLRHQAIGNWKSIYDPVTVAALAGHAVPGTAIRHYGDRKHVWPAERLQQNMLILPSKADIERIKDRLARGAYRRAMQQGIGGRG